MKQTAIFKRILFLFISITFFLGVLNSCKLVHDGSADSVLNDEGVSEPIDEGDAEPTDEGDAEPTDEGDAEPTDEGDAEPFNRAWDTAILLESNEDDNSFDPNIAIDSQGNSVAVWVEGHDLVFKRFGDSYIYKIVEASSDNLASPQIALDNQVTYPVNSRHS